MKRNVYLEGNLGATFGRKLKMNIEEPRQLIQCLEANFGETVRKYFIDAYENNVGFEIEVAGEALAEEELLIPLKQGDIVMTPIPAGSKSAGGKILGAIALITIAIYAPQFLGTATQAGASGTLGTGMVAGAATTQGSLGLALSGAMGTGWQIFTMTTLSMGTNLAIAGIQQMMAPDPSTDADQNTSYLFNGGEQNIIEGDPVPVLYGKLRVPGQPIAFEIKSGADYYSAMNNGIISSIPNYSTDLTDVVDINYAAIYETPGGSTMGVSITNSGGTSGNSNRTSSEQANDTLNKN